LSGSRSKQQENFEVREGWRGPWVTASKCSVFLSNRAMLDHILNIYKNLCTWELSLCKLFLSFMLHRISLQVSPRAVLGEHRALNFCLSAHSAHGAGQTSSWD
jgi:hypothetical protein